MPDITVITPTEAAIKRMTWLNVAHHSLHENDRSWEHVIVVDGGDRYRLPLDVVLCPHTRVVTLPKSYGAAAARNMGLHAAEGVYVTSLDDDDLLTPHSLDIRAAVLDTGTAWVAGQLAHLTPDGAATKWTAPTPVGHIAAGEVMNAWTDAAATVPLGPTTLMTTVERLRAVGGWAGLPTGEDLTMMAALTTVADGQMLDDIVYEYRSHPHQSLKSPDTLAVEQAAREVAFQRAAALR